MAISFALNIPSREEDPIHKISDIFVIGSIEGDLLLDDPSIESRHCSFLVNDDVVSVVDHNSSMGTFIGADRIPSEKMIILLEGDSIKFGVVEAKLIAQDIGDDEGANVVLYSLGEGGDEGKSVEQLIVDQILGEVASSVDDSEILEKAHEETKVMRMPKDHEYSMNEDDATGDIEIPREFKTLQVGETIDGADDATGDVDISEIQINTKEQIPYRSIAVAIEFSIAYALNYLILSSILTPMLSSLMLPLNSIPVLGPFLIDLAPLIPVLLIYTLIRVLSTYLIGVSYIQKILGFNGVFESKNMLLVREAVGVITAPFLIGEMLLLKGEESLKEKISKTYLVLDNKKRAVLYSAIFLPLSVVIAFASPLFSNFTIPESYLITKQVQVKAVADSDVKYKNSIYLGLSVGEKFSEQNIIYPLILIKGKMFNYQFKGLNLKQKKDFSFSSTAFDFLPHILKQMNRADPLFRINYPILNKIISEGYKNTEMAESELMILLEASFKLGLYSSFEHLTEYGPSFNAYLKFRENILSALNISSLQQLSFIGLHGKKYISFVSKASTGGFEQILLPLSFDMTKSYKIISKASLPELDHLTIALWSHSRVLPATDLNNVDVTPSDAFSLIDYLKKMKGKKEELSLYILSTMEELKEESLTSDSKLAKKNFKQSLNTVIKFVTRHLELKAELPQTDSLLEKLMELNTDE